MRMQVRARARFQFAPPQQTIQFDVTHRDAQEGH
jgi:hypothetical protein